VVPAYGSPAVVVAVGSSLRRCQHCGADLGSCLMAARAAAAVQRDAAATAPSFGHGSGRGHHAASGRGHHAASDHAGHAVAMHTGAAASGCAGGHHPHERRCGARCVNALGTVAGTENAGYSWQSDPNTTIDCVVACVCHTAASNVVAVISLAKSLLLLLLLLLLLPLKPLRDARE
jgi:hypothetical protein